MAKLLLLETATRICSVAVSDGTELVSIKESDSANSHSALLTSFIHETLTNANIKLSELDAIVVSKGPGSYTGLRIGVSSAKGLCYALDKPLISVNTLKSMAEGMIGMNEVKNENSLFCPMIDARRMEVYTAIYDQDNNEIKPTSAKIIDQDSFAELLKNHLLFFGGDGALKCKNVLASNENARFLDDFRISARHMIKMANQKFENQKFENVAYFEPYYLKDFIAGIPKVKGLR